MLQWERMGKKMLLIAPDTRYSDGNSSTVGDVIKRSYTSAIIRNVPVVTQTPGGDAVIDLGEIYKGDMTGFSRAFQMNVNPALSKWGSFKAFPQNVELPVETAVAQGPPGSPLTRIRLHYSLSSLPKTDYSPRVADDRIGYFMTVRKDWGKKHGEKTLFDRYVNRWDLRKVDPSLKLSPVKEPIVWYIEKTVPVKFRRYVKEGILEWNKAFEKCGFLDAVIVRQQTDEEFAELDPEDVRYNFFRWIVSGRAFAAGPSRAHPLTGQILDADIIFDDSFVRVIMGRYGVWEGPSADPAHDATLAEFFAANPVWKASFVPERLLPVTLAAQREEPLGDFDAQIEKQMFEHGLHGCSLAQGMQQEMAIAGLALKSAGCPEIPDELMGQWIKEVVMHEVGHCLGLRHNFKASSWLTFAEILAAEDSPEAATTGSVMDYNPVMQKLRGEERMPLFITRTLGPYDYWAIEYGYRPVEEPHKSEAELLKSVTDRVAEPGHDYATDYDNMFFSPDPAVNTYDYGKDGMEYVKYRMRQALKLIDDLDQWGIEDGESYAELRRAFDTLLGTYGSVARYAARYVGGMHTYRDHRGDPNARAPFEVVDAKTQREALNLVCERLFADAAFQFSPRLLNQLGAGRWAHWDSDEFDMQPEYPLHERIQRMQFTSLFQMLNPFTLNRIYDAELKVEADEEAMTVAELFETLTGSIWSELDEEATGTYSTRRPYISSMRRSLQRAYVQILINLTVNNAESLGIPADVRSVVYLTLSDLGERIDGRLGDGGKLDTFSRAHLLEAKQRIAKALDASFVAQ